ncbi:MAG: iron response transcriptional regulator IrrA [Pseudomonadota bacterium]
MKLRDCGLRFTRQRIDLAKLLFGNGGRHFTADMLHSEARGANIPVSLATVYNTLQHFAKAGLIRKLSTGGQTTWFDTNISEHHHLYYEDENLIADVPEGYLSVSNLPPVPEDMEIDRVDVVIRLKRRDGGENVEASHQPGQAAETDLP